MHFNPTAITFIGYLVLMVMIGFYAWHHTRSFGDYILGGRKLGGLVTALSVGASDMSGWLLMGVPARPTSPVSANPGSRSVSRSARG